MTGRYTELRRVAQDLGVDAVAFVPGPNFTRVLGHAFHSLTAFPREPRVVG